MKSPNGDTKPLDLTALDPGVVRNSRGVRVTRCEVQDLVRGDQIDLSGRWRVVTSVAASVQDANNVVVRFEDGDSLICLYNSQLWRADLVDAARRLRGDKS